MKVFERLIKDLLIRMANLLYKRAESAGRKLTHLEQLDIHELSQKIVDVNNAIDAPKEMKLLQKTMEVNLKSLKDESMKILEERLISSDNCAHQAAISGADLETLSNSISKQLPVHEKSILKEIMTNTEQIITDVKLIPVGVKANNKWDMIEEYHESSKDTASVPFTNVTYSTKRRNPPSMPSTNSNGTFKLPPKKALCDEEKTLAIDNIKSYEKFIKTSTLTKREFNRHFEKVKLVHTKPIRSGTLLIELATKEDAEEIVMNWKPECFSVDGGQNNKTTATLLKNKNLRCVATDVDPDHTNDFIEEEIRKDLALEDDDNIAVRRFINKAGKRLSTVMITFDKLDNYQASISKDQVLIGRSYCPFRKYVPKPYVVQCFNCYQFDHHADWCSRTRACPYCADNHKADDCTKKETAEHQKCVNCKKDNKHPSTSKACPSYLSKLEAVSLYNSGNNV